MKNLSQSKVDARWEWLESKNDWYVYDESIQKVLNNEFNNGKNNVSIDWL